MVSSQHSSLSFLPVELLRAVVAALEGDKRSLDALALVNHPLRLVSYEVLFKSLKITHSKGCKADRSLAAFVAFLPAAPVVAASLRSLHLLPGSMIRPETCIDMETMHRCLELLPNLRKLQVSSTPFRTPQDPSTRPLFPRLVRPALELVIHNPRTTFPHNPDPLALLDVFASVEAVSISQVLQPFWVDEALPPERRVTVRHLRITHTQAPAAAKCLRLLHAKLVPSSVESFELLAVDTSALTALNQPVRESGGGLRACTLNLVPLTIFSTDAEIARYMRLPSLASCELLRTLHLSLSLPLSSCHRERASTILQHCFEHIVAYARSLCELAVTLRVEPAREEGDAEVGPLATSMPWSALDAVVRASATLHAVRLQFHNGHHGPAPWFSNVMREAVRAGVSRETMRIVEVL